FQRCAVVEELKLVIEFGVRSRRHYSMESPEELDSDLYDRVGYLNLMNQGRDRDNSRKDNLRRARDDLDAPSPCTIDQGGIMGQQPPDPHIKFLWNESVDISEMAGVEQNDMLRLRIMLGMERISTESLSRYNVRGHMDGYDQPAIIYPRYRGPASRIRVPVGLKVIRKVGDRMEKENYPLPDESLSKLRFSGIFGYHMATASDRAVFPYLEDFEQIFLWFPPRHFDYAKEWGYALNGSRCYLIRNIERPIELVRNGKHKEVKQILSREAVRCTVRLREKGFRSMTDIREEVKADLINSSTRQLGFAQWKRFAPLNKYLLGLRPGELTVVTGGTGYGKTTFLCEYALDLFTQGVRTLFCSFEMPEEKILKWMLVQYAGVPLYRVEYSSAIDMWLDKFERTKGPLTIMKADEFREKSINQIASAIRSQVINSACQHVVIDNLQFLVNQSTMSDDQSSILDRFHMQDRFVGHMRALATLYGVHVTMVVHPRRIDAEAELDIQHFGGSARVTQEADNVLVLQRRRDDRDRGKFRKFLHILKNRYGDRKVEVDQLEMVFQPGTYSHTIIDHSIKT
ncbi:hypothetical protein GCK32_000237, partial [Trichostrongylus colubriformis]